MGIIAKRKINYGGHEKYCSGVLQQGSGYHSGFTLAFVLRAHCPQAAHRPHLDMVRAGCGGVGCGGVAVCMCLAVSDSCNPMHCSSPGSPVHGIFQARILEWVAIPFSGRSNPHLLHLLHCHADVLSAEPPGKPW